MTILDASGRETTSTTAKQLFVALQTKRPNLAARLRQDLYQPVDPSNPESPPRSIGATTLTDCLEKAIAAQDKLGQKLLGQMREQSVGERAELESLLRGVVDVPMQFQSVITAIGQCSCGNIINVTDGKFIQAIQGPKGASGIAATCSFCLATVSLTLARVTVAPGTLPFNRHERRAAKHGPR